jgi:DNA-directed RNA polymerase subunit RPC12/RpoP
MGMLELRKGDKMNYYCTFCEKDILEPVVSKIFFQKRNMYTCPRCGGKIIHGENIVEIIIPLSIGGCERVNASSNKRRLR